MSYSELDPRVFGFNHEGDLKPNEDFTGYWGEGVPSSDGEVVRLPNGVAPAQPPQQAQPMQQQAPPMQQPLYTNPTDQALYTGPAAQNLYNVVGDQVLYRQENLGGQQPVQHNAGGMPANTGAYAGVAVQTMPQGTEVHGHRHATQIHAPSAPFSGPGGTSPANRGGPNLPARAVAPPPPAGFNGAVHPMTIPGTYVPNEGNPQFAGYAGIDVDLGALDNYLGELSGARNRKDKEPKSREAREASGWVYRQFSNGHIQVVVSQDTARLPAGTMITPESDPKRWNAITAVIGTWESYIKGRWEKAGQTALTITEAAGKVAGSVRRRKGRRRRRRRAAPPVETAPPMPIEGEDEDTSEMPGWVLPVGVLAGAALIYFVVSSGKKGK